MTPRITMKEQLKELEKANSKLRAELKRPAPATEGLTTSQKLEAAQLENAELQSAIEANRPKPKEVSEVQRITAQLKQCDFTTDEKLPPSERLAQMKAEGDMLLTATNDLLNLCCRKYGVEL